MYSRVAAVYPATIMVEILHTASRQGCFNMILKKT
jgi:hypothetical protein